MKELKKNCKRPHVGPLTSLKLNQSTHDSSIKVFLLHRTDAHFIGTKISYIPKLIGNRKSVRKLETIDSNSS